LISFREGFVDSNGCLFTLCSLPEQRPKGFIESIFAASPSTLDREELCMYIREDSFLLLPRYPESSAFISKT